MKNQRTFMDELARKLKINDWYTLTVDMLRKHGGDGLLGRYNGSPSALLRAVYPEYHRGNNRNTSSF